MHAEVNAEVSQNLPSACHRQHLCIMETLLSSPSKFTWQASRFPQCFMVLSLRHLGALLGLDPLSADVVGRP